MSITITDLFCGAGGSSLGAEIAGAEMRLGLNHWPLAIETHATNFPNGDHDCADVSALTTSQIKRYPDSDILLASPECTNHSQAKGGKRVKSVAGSLFDDGPAGDDEQERSRATMWDVVRFTEQKNIKGKPYKAIIVENVVDAFKWGDDDDGQLFAAWRMAMQALGYRSKIVYLNSMFCPPTPQSRDRMYVVFWLKGAAEPDLTFKPISWCVKCSKIVDGLQTWKKPDFVWGRYGAQYLYSCPDCQSIVFPGAAPAASIIDQSLEAQVIGERKKDLAAATRERIRRGLERLSGEPFAFRLLHSANPRPLTLPLVTLTGRHDMGMVLPVAGNTFERTPGNRARDARTQPMDTIHTSLERAVVLPPEDKAVIHFTNNVVPGLPEREPVATMRAEGFHHGVVIANYDPGWARQAEEEPLGTLTTTDSHSLVIPFDRTGQPSLASKAPTCTLTTRDRVGLLVPPTLAEGDSPTQKEWQDADIDACRFRMFSIPEIAETMQMHEHADGSDYVVLGNKREQMAQYGNAVTPPAMRMLVERVLQVIQ